MSQRCQHRKWEHLNQPRIRKWTSCARLKFLPVTSIVLCQQEGGADALKFVFMGDDGEEDSMDVLLTQRSDWNIA